MKQNIFCKQLTVNCDKMDELPTEEEIVDPRVKVMLLVHINRTQAIVS